MSLHVLILQTVARPLYVLILLASVWVLLRGHNEPGGGFIAALVATCATVLWAVARGTPAAMRRLPGRSPVVLGAAGGLLAAASGLPAWAFGDPYLTHLWGTLDLGPTELKVSTVLAFDLGVYLCVWGALSGYVLALVGLDEPPPGSATGAAADERGAP